MRSMLAHESAMAWSAARQTRMISFVEWMSALMPLGMLWVLRMVVSLVAVVEDKKAPRTVKSRTLVVGGGGRVWLNPQGWTVKLR